MQLLLVFLALRPGLSDAAREGGSVSRPPYDYIAMAKNKNVHGDRETTHKVINRNLNRASGTLEEKMEVSACQPGLHAASACPTVPTPAPLPPSFARRLLLHRRALTRCSPPSFARTAAPSPPPSDTLLPPSFAVGRSLGGSVRQLRKRQDEGGLPRLRGHGPVHHGAYHLRGPRHGRQNVWP